MVAANRRRPFRVAAPATIIIAVSATGVASGRDSGQDRSRAVQKAIDGGKARNVNLVTGDHAHTSPIVEVGSAPAGFSSILATDEGQQLQVTYGTGNAPTSQGHTGFQLRVAAMGPQAANVVGMIDQTGIATVMRRALRL